MCAQDPPRKTPNKGREEVKGERGEGGVCGCNTNKQKGRAGKVDKGKKKVEK